MAAPDDCDLKMSLTFDMIDDFDRVYGRVQVADEDMQDEDARYFYQTHYVVATELEAARWDNSAHRRFTPTWDGSKYTFSNNNALTWGVAVEAWRDATITSATNGEEDGRVFLGCKVTGPVDGMYHYEYALQNRDNDAGVSAFRLPICPTAEIVNAGFSDVDGTASNDWSIEVVGSELVFSTTDNPLEWNTIYNFWFDSDAAPIDLSATLEAFDTKDVEPAYGIATSVPGGRYNLSAGPGCAEGTPPALNAQGAPARATLGNDTFALESTGHAPGATTLLLFGTGRGKGSPVDCPFWVGQRYQTVAIATADEDGAVRYELPVPDAAHLEGFGAHFQTVSIAPGSLPGEYSLSDGLIVRVGDSISDCP